MAGQAPPGYTINEALVAIGNGKFQRNVFLYAVLGSLGEAMELMVLTYIGLAVKDEFQLTSSQENLISIVTYVGLTLGTWIWSAVSDTFGRKPGFLGSTIVTSLAGLISCAAPNYVTLLILRFILGLGLGGTHVFTTWFMEFVPTLTRGKWMIAFLVSCSIGTSTEALLALEIVERYGWRLLLGVSSLPSLVALLFYTNVPESPRYLYAKGELGEASRILNWGAALNKSLLPRGRLISAHTDESTHNVQPSINTPSAPPMIGEVSQVNESKESTSGTEKAEGEGTSEEGAQNEREVVRSEKDEIKDVSLDIDKTVAGEIKIDEARHTSEEDDQVDQAPKVEQENSENEFEDETNEKTRLIMRHNNTHELLRINSMVERITQLRQTIVALWKKFVTSIAHLGQTIVALWKKFVTSIAQLFVQAQLRLAAFRENLVTSIAHLGQTIAQLRLAALWENLVTSIVESKSQLAQLFSPTWRMTTALLLILFFLNTYSYSGIIHLTSELKSGNTTDPRFYNNVFIISLAELPGLFLAYCTMERETLGRIMSMAILLSLGFIGFFIQVMDQQTIIKTTVFLTRVVMSGSFAVMQIYTEEVYPTQLRTLGVGLATVVGRVGSIVLPLVGEWMTSADGNKTPAMVMFAIKIAVCIVCPLLLPIETRGRVLIDDD